MDERQGCCEPSAMNRTAHTSFTHIHTHNRELLRPKCQSAKAEKPASTGRDSGLRPQARGFPHGHSMGASGLVFQPWSPGQRPGHSLQPLDLTCKKLSQIPGCPANLLLLKKKKKNRCENLKFQRDQERQSKKREEMLLAKAINAAGTL